MRIPSRHPLATLPVITASGWRMPQVYAIDKNAERLQIAHSLGAELVPEGQDAVTFLRSVSGGRGMDCIMEAVGSPGALRVAFDGVRMGGEPSLPPNAWS